ncbi:hypothetical protein [Streptococcus suis]|uniref:hypothetical protein n=1 Tax=Streptococcus suis TaxID=1307 RepID=UPI000413D747|nr:hypothetical protein [Streptococcus suis]MDW8777728.1 hypothetical protein [Streptococcus suis]HEL2313601.1 hypothetical protein [Streptococcus suis]HEM5138947.1 hypothetical protein [Streptococcus suis]HEM5173749.1 hypothetical protein [Streptococcus suis]
MNQEQVARKMTDISKLSGEVLLKFLWYIIQESAEKYKYVIENKTFTGETSWNAFLATSEDKYFKEFLAGEMHVESLKQYLKEHNIGFAMQQLPNGKMEIAIDAKNVQQLENFLKQFKEEITTEAGGKRLIKLLLKTPQKMSLEEKLKYYQAKTKEEIKNLDKTKTRSASKEKGREI